MPVPRNGRGQYLIPVVEGDKRRAHRRATTIAKVLDDQSMLMSWSQRMVAIGLGRRPDLLAMAATADPEDRKTLNEVCDSAFEAGGGTVKRNTGTSFHAAAEIVNRGGEPLPLFAEGIADYQAKLAQYGLEPIPHLVERTLVLGDYEIAGTFDMALTDGEQLYVGDFKTGGVDFAALAISIQLAIYANADGMLSTDYERVEKPPEFNREKAIVVQAPGGEPPVQFWEVDLVAGWEAFQLALKVEKARKRSEITPW